MGTKLFDFCENSQPKNERGKGQYHQLLRHHNETNQFFARNYRYFVKKFYFRQNLTSLPPSPTHLSAIMLSYFQSKLMTYRRWHIIVRFIFTN